MQCKKYGLLVSPNFIFLYSYNYCKNTFNALFTFFFKSGIEKSTFDELEKKYFAKHTNFFPLTGKTRSIVEYYICIYLCKTF